MAVNTPQNPNQFNQAPVLGMTDLRFNGNTLAVQFDPAGAGTLVSGQACKWSTVASGVPMVVPSTAASDIVAGFVNFNIKDISYVPGNHLEISQSGNVQYLLAGAAIDRGEELTQDPSTVGEVIPVTGASGFPIVGYALDSVADTDLVRVWLYAPVARLDS